MSRAWLGKKIVFTLLNTAQKRAYFPRTKVADSIVGLVPVPMHYIQSIARVRASVVDAAEDESVV
jgi:hypothetical protein